MCLEINYLKSGTQFNDLIISIFIRFKVLNLNLSFILHRGLFSYLLINL